MLPFNGDFWTPPPAVPPAVYLETEPDGTGTQILSPYQLYLDPGTLLVDSLTLYAVLRDSGLTYLDNVAVTFEFTRVAGYLSLLSEVAVVAGDSKSLTIGGGDETTPSFGGRFRGTALGYGSQWSQIVWYVPPIGEIPDDLTEIPVAMLVEFTYNETPYSIEVELQGYDAYGYPMYADPILTLQIDYSEGGEEGDGWRMWHSDLGDYRHVAIASRQGPLDKLVPTDGLWGTGAVESTVTYLGM